MSVKRVKFLYGVVKPMLLVMLGAGWFALISGLNWPLVRPGAEIDQPALRLIPRDEFKWQFETGGRVVTSPAITAGMVYFGSMDSHLYAVEVQTGWAKWKFKTRGELRSSPVSAGGLIYFGSDDGYLYALDSQTGQPRWKLKTGFGLVSSPVIYEGSVFVGGDDHALYVLDSQTGEARWRFETQGNVTSSPTISRGMLYFGSDDFHLYAIRLNDHCGDCLRIYSNEQRMRFTNG